MEMRVLTMIRFKVWVWISIMLLTINTTPPCINRRIMQTRDLRTSLALLEADIVLGNYSSVMLIGMIKSPNSRPSLLGAEGVDFLLVALSMVKAVVLGLLANPTLWGNRT